MTTKELSWKPVKGYEDRYRINELGIIESLPRDYEYGYELDMGIRRVKPKIIKPRKDTNGDAVQLKNEQGVRMTKVRKLYLDTFGVLEEVEKELGKFGYSKDTSNRYSKRKRDEWSIRLSEAEDVGEYEILVRLLKGVFIASSYLVLDVYDSEKLTMNIGFITSICNVSNK